MSIQLKGKYADAIIYTDLCEQEAIEQINELLNQPMVRDTHPRFMPDVHAGKGCVVGTTMHIQDKIIPNLVGVDIGCGMEVTPIVDHDLDLEKLDTMLHLNTLVPSSFHQRNQIHPYIQNCHLEDLYCKDSLDMNTAKHSLGSLGGGNHFIEINQDQKGNYILVIHSGSRHLGVEVCNYYQKKAIQNIHDTSKIREQIISQLKADGRQKEIADTLKKIKDLNKDIPDTLAYLEGEDLAHYLHDMKITQKYALWSRKAMSDTIINYMGWCKAEGSFTTIHNYIDIENKILRKGSISAKKGEKVIIPLSMKDGSIIAIGKGNKEWNESAPHGAGRSMSRSKARETLSMEEFQKQMQGIYTTCVGESTIDESPMAYKPVNSIIENIKDTVDVLEIIKPVYNFKASS